MCGLAGITSTYITTQEIGAFKELMLISSLRGMDSTGCATIRKIWGKTVKDDNYYECVSHTMVAPSYDFINDKGWNKHVNKGEGTLRALIGHCRHATKGKVTMENAHPFIVDHITGVHNGTIEGDFDFRKDYETDSEAVFRNIAEKGLKEALDHINSAAHHVAYAIVFYDKKTEMLHMIRNDHRTLFYGVNKEETTLMWASEAPFLHCIQSRNPVDFEKVYSLSPHTLLSIKVSNNDPVKNRELVKDYITPPPYKSYGYNWDKDKKEYVKDTKSSPPFFPTRSGSITKAITDSKKAKPKIDAKSYVGFKGIILSRELAVKYLNKGCAWCSSPQGLSDPVRWIGISEFVCGDCKLDPFVLEYIAANGQSISDDGVNYAQ